MRGLDRWGSAVGLIVVGRTLPSSGTIRRMTEALTGVAQASGGYQRAQIVRELADGRMRPVEWWRYSDAIGEALRWQCCEAEVTHIIGRARGVNRTADTPVSILVLSDLALPLPVEPITLESLHPSPADLMMAVGGLGRASYPPLPAPCPATWLPPHPSLRLSSLRLARQFRTNVMRPRELLAVALPPEPVEVEVPEPLGWLPPCPCCGGRMTIIETFGRWRQPRAPPHSPASTGSTPS